MSNLIKDPLAQKILTGLAIAGAIPSGLYVASHAGVVADNTLRHALTSEEAVRRFSEDRDDIHHTVHPWTHAVMPGMAGMSVHKDEVNRAIEEAERGKRKAVYSSTHLYDDFDKIRNKHLMESIRSVPITAHERGHIEAGHTPRKDAGYFDRLLEEVEASKRGYEMIKERRGTLEALSSLPLYGAALGTYAAAPFVMPGAALSVAAMFLKEAAETIKGGVGDGKPDSAFSAKALAQGVKEEMEHTDDPKKAKEIAKDHLTEHSKYYSALKQMEESLEKQEKRAADEADLSKLRLRHLSSDLHPVLAPLSYDKLREIRGSSYPMEERIKTEDKYRELLQDHDSSMSFVYSTIGGRHAMEPAKEYPGYTHYADLPRDQLEKIIFHVIHSKGSTRPRAGQQGLAKALKDWNRTKEKGWDYPKEYKDGWVLRPRIEVVTRTPIPVKSYVPQEEDRKNGDEEVSVDHLSEKKAGLTQEYQPRKHQESALKKILNNQRILLAHATGTGKTPTSVAGVERLREAGKADKTLVILPAALKQNYKDTISKFTDSSFSDGVDGKSDYQIVSYDALRRDPKKLLEEAAANTIVADELHRAKDSKSQTYKALREISDNVDNFIGLTGSLVSNHPKEVVPLLNIVQPKQDVSPNEQSFQRRFTKRTKETYKTGVFSTAQKSRVDLKATSVLGPKLRKYLDYVSHDQMKDQMPRVTINDVKVPMTEEQNRLYEFAMGTLSPSQRELIRSGLPASQSEASEILARIMKTRLASNAVHTHKDITPLESSKQTPKLKRVLDDVEEHLKKNKDGQAVLYSHFVQGGADALVEGLKHRGIEAGLFAGVGALGIKDEDRHKAVQDFKEGKTKAIILTPAANEGISLNNATAFFEVDRHYNPEKNQQAIARAVRLGGQSHRKPEDRHVEVYRYYSKPVAGFLDRLLGRDPKGVDEWIQTVADEKDRLNKQFRDVVGGKK